jgi:hypothetical protein
MILWHIDHANSANNDHFWAVVQETHSHGNKYEVPLESSWTVTVAIISVKEDERGGQSHTSASLLHQSAT